jgi:ERCC4-type nuclease
MKKVRKDKPIVIIVDDREKKPWKFKNPSTVRRMPIGDYTAMGYEDLILIERKGSMSDLCISLGQNRNRFFQRMTSMVKRAKFPILALEMNFPELLAGSKYSKVYPASLIGSIRALMGMGVIPLFMGHWKRFNQEFMEHFIIRVVRKEREERDLEVSQ